MKIKFLLFLLLPFFMSASEQTFPKYLYKVVSTQNWQASQSSDRVQLSSDDDAFIHFSTEDQLDRIVKKYFSNTPYVVLKIETEKLPGELVFEANPGGSNKYYHLYNGWVPKSAIVSWK